MGSFVSRYKSVGTLCKSIAGVCDKSIVNHNLLQIITIFLIHYECNTRKRRTTRKSRTTDNDRTTHKLEQFIKIE